jgi:hypothetical protein
LAAALVALFLWLYWRKASQLTYNQNQQAAAQAGFASDMAAAQAALAVIPGVLPIPFAP